MTPEEQITGNIDLASALLDAIVDDPALMDEIPDGATVVNIPFDNPELGHANLRMAQDVSRRGGKLVVVSHQEAGVVVQSIAGVR